MPIRRPNENDPDWMAKKQDKELIYLEQRISALYEEASTELSNEYERFYSNYQLEYERRLAMVESGELSQDSFEVWCRNQIFQSNRYQAMIRVLTDVLVNADVAAMAAVNEQLPYTLAESYDFISSLGFEAADQAGISMGTFQIYNAESVQAIIRDNPDLLPVVDLPEDELWNKNHINNEITQGIIQGNSMQQVARRLQNVAAMDNRAAIRNARTAMTAAENLGRSESARRLKEKGLPVKEVWSATKDSRTRNTHLLLDGTEKDDNGYYGADFLRVPLRFPADPLGEPQEIYNCRCRDNVVIAGLDHSKDDELYENFMRENYPEDWQALQQREAESGKADERRQALERQARLRAERQSQTYQYRGHIDDGVIYRKSSRFTSEGREAMARDLGISTKKAQEIEKAVDSYGGMNYSQIRAAYRGDTEDAVAKKQADIIEEFIELSPRWDGGQLSRGLWIRSESDLSDLLEASREGDAIDLMGMSSWTSNREISNRYARAYYVDMPTEMQTEQGRAVIFITNNTRTEFGTSVRHLTGMQSEDEVLISGQAEFVPTQVVESREAIYIYGDLRRRRS